MYALIQFQNEFWVWNSCNSPTMDNCVNGLRANLTESLKLMCKARKKLSKQMIWKVFFDILRKYFEKRF